MRLYAGRPALERDTVAKFRLVDPLGRQALGSRDPWVLRRLKVRVFRVGPELVR